MHVTEAKGIDSVAQTVHMRSYPLEGDNPYECGRETEHQAEEPEDIHADGGGVDSRLSFGNPIFARRLGSNLPQELNAFLSRVRSEVLLRFNKESSYDSRE
jgi:hypothetical protein